jgi:Protein of unknown function (DUF1761)
VAFAGINYAAVILAAIAAFVVGGIWYGVLGRRWMAALGKSQEELKRRGPPTPVRMGIAFVADLVMAYMLAGLVGHLGQVTSASGVISAFFVWIGFVITTQTVNYTFQGQRWSLTLIDGGHWLAALLVMGAIIGAMGV